MLSTPEVVEPPSAIAAIVLELRRLRADNDRLRDEIRRSDPGPTNNNIIII
jgi:hypothetical protein